MENLRGYYVNLAAAQERRTHMESELRRVGLEGIYARFEAIDGRTLPLPSHVRVGPGKWGIWMTWRRLLDQNAGADTHLHILEDDIVFSDRFGSFARGLDEGLENLRAEFRGWDILYTSMLTNPHPNVVQHMLRTLQDAKRDGKIRLINAKGPYLASNASVLINKESVAKLRSCLGDDVAGRKPLDLHIRTLLHSGTLKGLVTVPYLTKLSDLHLSSQIDQFEKVDKPERLVQAWNIFDGMFFDGADLPALKKQIAILSQNGALEGLEGIEDNLEIYKHFVTHILAAEKIIE